ncbi:MAG TPA: cytoplasmic protein [Vicinamibacteria bacterium]|jgi:hypothetical protein|nr:cytoplasmic protein [Vicinamibacteria bacterium]
MQTRRRPSASPESFEEFQATALYCGRCKSAQPVRERLLLVLPDGELREYVCSVCGSSVGSRKLSGPPPPLVVAS